MMKEQHNNLVPKTNRLAIVGLMVGILSLLPYLPGLITSLIQGGFIYSSSDILALEKNTFYGGFLLQAVNAVPFIFYRAGGILFGGSSFIIGTIALRQIKKRENVEKGYGMVIASIVFSILGIIANIGCIVLILSVSL